MVTVANPCAGCNELVEAFSDLGSSTTFVLPISDNGGSSSEIIRVCGGPSIGDLRSRLVRLIPRTSASSIAIRNLFEYRLSPVGDSGDIKAEWLSIVEGRHKLWRGIPADRRECIRAFLGESFPLLHRPHGLRIKQSISNTPCSNGRIDASTFATLP